MRKTKPATCVMSMSKNIRTKIMASRCHCSTRRGLECAAMTGRPGRRINLPEITMPRKRRSSPKAPHHRDIFDLTKVEFLVTNEQKVLHSPAVDHILDQASPLLRAGDGEGAERLFRQALELEPNKVDLLNDLAASLSLQGRQAEAILLLEVLYYQHPDYLFARTGLAKVAMQKGDLERAQALLEPLYKRRKFHVSEYDALCATQIDLLILQNDRLSAQTWFDMWKDCNPQNPKLDYYRRVLIPEARLRNSV
jgi:tetratricopeptide (TPR) repeat protein